MTDAPSISTPVQADPASPSPVTGLNAKTARRQKLLLGSLGALALVGGSWFIMGGDDNAKSDDPTAAQTIDTKIAELLDSKAGLAARALDASDEELPSSADVQTEAMVALLTEALEKRAAREPVGAVPALPGL